MNNDWYMVLKLKKYVENNDGFCSIQFVRESGIFDSRHWISHMSWGVCLQIFNICM